MKNQIVSIIIAGIFFLFLQSFMPESQSENGFPEEIGTILKSACYDCHATGARSKDALKAIDFDRWDEYRLTKKIGLLGEIGEMVEKGIMPPQKYLEHKPDRQMSEAQKKLLCDWTKSESEKLMQGN